MELYKPSMQTLSYFSGQCWFYMKNISAAGSHIFIYIYKRRCQGVDGICPTPGMGYFAKIVKGLKSLSVFAESSVFGF